MIERFTVFHKGGIVLWQKQFGSTMSGAKTNPVNNLINEILLEERSGDDSFTHEEFNMKWVQENDFGLIFVCVYQKVLQLLYIDELLEKARRKFVSMFKDNLVPVDHSIDFDFEETFLSMQKKLETSSLSAKSGGGASRAFEDTDKWRKTKEGQDEFMHGKKPTAKEAKKKAADEAAADEPAAMDEAEERRQAAMEKFRTKSGGRNKAATSPGRSPRSSATKSPKKKKEARTWCVHSR